MQSPEKIAEDGESGEVEASETGVAAEERSELIPGTGYRRRTLSSSLRNSKILTQSLKDRLGRGEAGAPDTIPVPEESPEKDDSIPGSDYHQRTQSNDLNHKRSHTTSLKGRSLEWWKKLCKKSVVWVLLLLVVITVIALCINIGNVPACKCPSCPNKWTKYDDICYFVSKNRSIWLESHHYCEKEGGSLLILNDTVQQQIEELFHLCEDHWIGLQKNPESKEWKWVNGSIYRDSVRDGGDPRMNCAYINGGIGALDCTSARSWICIKSLWSMHIGGDETG